MAGDQPSTDNATTILMTATGVDTDSGSETDLPQCLQLARPYDLENCQSALNLALQGISGPIRTLFYLFGRPSN